ncbi:GIY-YIG nuclease family protein [Lysobacter sp. A378]
MERQPATYLLASARNGILYVGVTSNLVKRVWEHRNHVMKGFTEKHGITHLVWYEMHDTMEAAISHEKRIKKWRRDWKMQLIETTNPYWNDLWTQITGAEAEVAGFPLSRE